MGKKIVVINNDNDTIDHIKAIFQGRSFNLYYARNFEEAKRFFKEHPVGVVVTDLSINGKPAIPFVKELRNKYPMTVSVVLTESHDFETVVDAINEGHIWKFVMKGDEKRSLWVAVKNAWEYHKEKRDRHIVMSELALKNEKLELMNEILEEKVKDRTWELNERTEILSMMLEGASLEKLMNRLCKVVSHIFHIEEVYLYVPFLEETYCQHQIEMEREFSSLIKKVMKTGEISVEKNVAAIPLAKAGKKLGVLIVDNSRHIPINNVREKFERIATMMNLVLYQHKILQEVPQTIDSIDKLLSEM